MKCAIGGSRRTPATPTGTSTPTRLAVLGRSAGGHLALMAAYTANDSDLPAELRTGDSSVEAVVALYAPTDLSGATTIRRTPASPTAAARYERLPGRRPEMERDRWRALSPVARVTATVAAHPAGSGRPRQFVRPEHVQLLAARLRTNGVPFETLLIPYAQHAFDFVRRRLLEPALSRPPCSTSFAADSR